MSNPGLYQCVQIGRFHLSPVTHFTLVCTLLLGTIQSEIGEIPLLSVENVARKGDRREEKYRRLFPLWNR